MALESLELQGGVFLCLLQGVVTEAVPESPERMLRTSSLASLAHPTPRPLITLGPCAAGWRGRCSVPSQGVWGEGWGGG